MSHGSIPAFPAARAYLAIASNSFERREYNPTTGRGS